MTYTINYVLEYYNKHPDSQLINKIYNIRMVQNWCSWNKGTIFRIISSKFVKYLKINSDIDYIIRHWKFIIIII